MEVSERCSYLAQYLRMYSVWEQYVNVTHVSFSTFTVQLTDGDAIAGNPCQGTNTVSISCALPSKELFADKNGNFLFGYIVRNEPRISKREHKCEPVNFAVAAM